MMKKTTKESKSLYSNYQCYLGTYLPGQKGASPKTIESYSMTLTQLFLYVTLMTGIVPSRLEYSNFSMEVVTNFLTYMEKNKCWSVSTRNQKLAAIRAFFKYCSEHDFTVMSLYQSLLAIPQKKVPQKEIEFFSEKALGAILAQPDQSTEKGVRDIVLMTVLYDSAARVQELLDIKLKDIDFDRKCVHLCGKGRKWRSVPLMDKTCESLRKYIKRFHKNPTEEEYLFYTIRGGEKVQMSKDNVETIVAKYAMAAREKYEGKNGGEDYVEIPKHVYPHMFRHSRAMHLYRNGMNLATVSQILGHADIVTTLDFYANADAEMKRDAIAKATAQTNAILTTKLAIDMEIKYDDETIKKLLGVK